MKIKKTLKVILISLFIILVIIRLAIPIGGTIIINRTLPKLLNTDASVGYISMLLIRGKVSIGKIKIAQPKGFDGEPLLDLQRLSVDIDLPSLKTDTKIIQSIHVKKLHLNLIRGTNGVFNASLLSSSSESDTNSQPSTIALVINKFKATNLTISYQDLSMDPPMLIDMQHCNITATNLAISPTANNQNELISSIILTAILKQKNTNDAYLGLISRTSTFGPGIPALNALLRLDGFELKSLGKLLYPGTVQALGGTCVDINTDLAMSQNLLDCKIKIKSKSATMKAAIGGTPQKPKIDKSTPLGSIIGRPGAVIGNLLKDTTSAGGKIISGAGKTVGAVGKGAVKVAGDVGKGMFHTVKGIVTLDSKDIKKGLKETTVDTVKDTTETVTDTADAAVSGVANAGDSLSGHERRDSWRDGSRDRWESNWKEAQNKIRDMPYPKP